MYICERRHLPHLSPCVSIWNLSANHAIMSSPEEKRWKSEVTTYAPPVTKAALTANIKKYVFSLCVHR